MDENIYILNNKHNNRHILLYIVLSFYYNVYRQRIISVLTFLEIHYFSV